MTGFDMVAQRQAQTRRLQQDARVREILSLEARAREIIAKRADAAGEIAFASEARAGAWDHTNRADIMSVLRELRQDPNAFSA